MTLEQCIKEFRRFYDMLFPDGGSMGLADSLWDSWETVDFKRPDTEGIAGNHANFEKGFFYDLVKIAKEIQPHDSEVAYCPFCIDDYNCKAFTAEDGSVVLVDELFFQLLFMITMLLFFDAYGFVKDDEREEVKYGIKEAVQKNFIDKKRTDYSAIPVFKNIMKRSYEHAECAVYLFNSFKAFVLCHELGHLFLGHVTGKEKHLLAFRQAEQVLEVDSRAIESEYEADLFGYDVFIRTMKKKSGLEFALFHYQFPFAPILLFDIFSRLEAVWYQHNGDAKPASTHPPLALRKKALTEKKNIDLQHELYGYLTESLDELMPA